MELKEKVYVPLVRLELKRDKLLHYYKCQFSGADEVVEWVKKYVTDADREYLLAISVDAACCPVAIEILAIGGVSHITVDPRSVFKHALLTNASSLILVHNHPSNYLKPSMEDYNFTKKIKEAGKLLGIEILDHIVIGSDGAYIKLTDDYSIGESIWR